MPKKSVHRIDHKTLIVKAALRRAAENGWVNLQLHDIAKTAKIALKDVEFYAPDKAALLVLIGQHVDRQALLHPVDADGSAHDRVFEALMNRFDILQDDRAGFVAILRGLGADWCEVAGSVPHLAAAMAQVLEICGIDGRGARGNLRVLGLSLIYLNAVRVWLDDESEDLAKTMAALDHGLVRGEQLAELLKL